MPAVQIKAKVQTDENNEQNLYLSISSWVVDIQPKEVNDISHCMHCHFSPREVRKFEAMVAELNDIIQTSNDYSIGNGWMERVMVSLTFCTHWMRFDETTCQKEVTLSLTSCQPWMAQWDLMRLLRRKKGTSYWSQDEGSWDSMQKKSPMLITFCLSWDAVWWDYLVEKGYSDSLSVIHGMRSDNTAWKKTGVLPVTHILLVMGWDETNLPKTKSG